MTPDTRESSGPGSGSTPDDALLRAAIPRDRGVRHVRLGVFVLLGIVSFIAVLFLLTDPATMRGRYMLVTTLDDAGGVRRGDPIQMRGVIVGRVRGFEMNAQGRVDITLELEGEWQVPEGSSTELAEAGIFGGRTVDIIPGSGPGYLQEYDTIPGRDQGGGLMANAGELSEQAGDLLVRLQTLLDTPTVASVQGTTREVLGLAREFRETIAEQRDEIGRLTASLNRAAVGIEEAAEAGGDVASAASRADTLLAELAATQARLDDVLVNLDTVLGRVARGEGTLGRLAQDESIYDNLDQALVSLNDLLVDVKANPGRYVKIEIF